MFCTVVLRSRVLVALFIALAVCCTATSCGTGGIAAKEMVLLEIQFLDRSLAPTAPTGTQSLPRNAILGFVFSELVSPESVTNQTIQLRFGPAFQTVPSGSFSVDGNRVLFDPTITETGQPNPTGLSPTTQYALEIPGFEEQSQVVVNLDSDPNLTTFITQFTTSDGWLRELAPPSIIDVVFVPDVDPLTKQVPGNGLMGLVFSEPMDPQAFVLGLDPAGPDARTTVDIRYTDDPINQNNSLDGIPLAGAFTPSADYRTWFFKPLFSFGDAKLVFTVEVFQDITDLAGNLLVNPRSFGPFTVDGLGIAAGKVISEDFLTTDNRDPAATDADWGSTEEGIAQGQPVTSRQVYIFSYAEMNSGSDSGRGQYGALAAPMIGDDLNAIVNNVNPPTSMGRRVMWSFSDTKIGARGAITGIGWGPDSNATFAAHYDNIRLRLGYQQANSESLAPTFSGNYEGRPTLVYSGDYDVQQAMNIGNTPGHPATPHVGGYQFTGPPFGFCTATWNQPAFDYTGFYDWPELTTFFEWDPGDPGVENDRVLIFDASCPEGSTFQSVRSWFGVTFPCSGVLITGLPLTRLRSTYEGETPNPADSIANGIQNPEQSISDTCFTLTTRTSIAQSRFYGASGETFGDNTDYFPAILTPAVQSGGAQVVVEYQGADAIEADLVTINQAAPHTDWVQDINQCDGMRHIRYRLRLISNLVSLERARVETVVIPMVEDN